MTKFRNAIVVGASSGLGAEIARQLGAAGTKVAAVARRKELLSELGAGILAYEHDVTDYEATPDLFEKITGDLGGLDLIVYAAGVMPKVGEEEFDFAKDRHIFEVNVLGAMAWLDLAATRMGAAGHGSILGIGSVAGDRGRAGQPAYNASKAALATYLEALRNRLTKKGVVVVTVKPGPVLTPMTQGLDIKGMMDVRDAASKIIAKADKPGEHYLKITHRAIFFVIRHIPSAVFRRLKL